MNFVTTGTLNFSAQLVKTVHFFHSKGWTPATSSNHSFRLPAEETDGAYAISRSGVDKGHFSEKDILIIDHDGKVMGSESQPSAELAMHLMLYNHSPEVGAVLHTHSVANTVLSIQNAQKKFITLKDFEILKGIEGVTTHESSINVPIFANSQDITALAATIAPTLANNTSYSFLLVGHGLYAWGRNIAEAKRHIETLEFIFECLLHLNMAK